MESEQTMANQLENVAEEVDVYEITEGEEPAVIAQPEAQESAATQSADDSDGDGE